MGVIISNGINYSGSGGGGGGNAWSPHCIIASDTGATVTATKGSIVLNASETSEGVYELDLPSNNYGEWTFHGVLDGSDVQTTVDIKIVQVYNINFIDGSTATPTDDVDILLQCAAIYDSEIETISDLLADEATLSTVIASNNAMNYMVRSTSWATIITANQTAMNYIGLNNYASDTLRANPIWKSAICNSQYIESVYNGKIPPMTSNSTPSGQCSASLTNRDEPAYKAFDNNNSTRWWAYNPNQSSNAPIYLYYTFDVPVAVEHLRYTNGNNYSCASYKLQASNDNFSTKVDLVTVSSGISDATQTIKTNVDNTTKYKNYRVAFTPKYYSSMGYYYASANEVQMYYREDI